MLTPSDRKLVGDIAERHKNQDAAYHDGALTLASGFMSHSDRATLLRLIQRPNDRDALAKIIQSALRGLPEKPRAMEIVHAADECVDEILAHLKG